jgi:adenylate kinase family enzyme
MSKSNIKKDDTELKINQNQINDDNDNKGIQDNLEKKIKSKFNLLEQGRLMLIGNEEELSKNLIILGPKGSGKSTIFSLLTTGAPNNYSDNGTCGINFGFMRSLNSVKKKIINIYEIGSDIENLILIKSILNNTNLDSTIILIILDFENPSMQLSYLLKFISGLNKVISKIIDGNSIEDNIKNRISFYDSNKKPGEVNVFPIETYVIGNKYDLLEVIDIEKLKWICPSLRYFCYINALNLIFYSSKKKELINSLYNTIVEVGFRSIRKDSLKKYTQKKSSKALYINYYNESLDEIGEPKIPVTVTGDIQQRWKETYEGIFKNFKKNENDKKIDLDENYYQIYKEPKIDRELKLFNDFKESNNDNQNKKISYKNTGKQPSGIKFSMKKK